MRQKVIKCYFSCKSDLLIECCPSANISCIIRVRSSSKIQSNMYIIKGIQRNLKMCLYQQLPFIYKIKLYALFINGGKWSCLLKQIWRYHNTIQKWGRNVTTRATIFDSHWKIMESWIGTKICSGYTASALFLKTVKLKCIV